MQHLDLSFGAIVYTFGWYGKHRQLEADVIKISGALEMAVGHSSLLGPDDIPTVKYSRHQVKHLTALGSF